MSAVKTNSQPVLQPVADALKLFTKEIIRPSAADKVLFFLAPVLAIMPALAAWVVIPFAPDAALANVNTGLLLLLAIHGDVWRCHRRLGIQFKICLSGRHSRFGADDEYQGGIGNLFSGDCHGVR